MTERDRRRDRVRELLDAVLDDAHDDLGAMAAGAHASAYHFARTVSATTGEPPVAMRRRVALERAAWRLRGGASVTETAWEAGYDSVEGFARAYARAWGHPPSATPAGHPSSTAHWLDAPNGVHFHSPTALWVAAGEPPVAADGAGAVTMLMAHHDLADTAVLLERCAALPDDEWTRPRVPGAVLVGWAGPEESLALVLGRVVGGLEAWLAAIEGLDAPGGPEPDTVAGLRDRLDAVGPRWLAALADVDARGAWGDRLVDALCDPPESFVLGSVLAHVLTFDAQRRGLARVMLAAAGLDGGPEAVGEHDGDPVTWLRGT
ncbi:helix-turn-helix domain-containing protein [Nocardioides sp. CFH 31398]|uniref:helix-turn-helix domain-containing protein n=1 Tax=Nocardioides sp. CFH 31398 TaxID=2919579 RepID=UPI001F06ABB5|nr:helix-turn-helix domain-containing protein [Nocardioides sp. CFH 31398]MCH1867572.1 helix-turn-helix domain-containing protein [Nocardioides sp. CFH 31398]